MTDGIIQEVLKKYRLKTRETGCVYTADLYTIEQELIKKIRERSKRYYDSYKKLVILDDLIGDNNE